MANALFDLTMAYEYAGKEVRNFLELELEKRVKKKAFDQAKLEQAAKIMEAAARRFVISNGTVDTRTLIKGITHETGKNKIKLYVPSSVTDKHGRYYAGHIEFGFRHWKNNMFVGPFPYLRPAMRYGADVTREDVSNNVAALITGQRNWWTGSSLRGHYMAGQMLGTKAGNLHELSSTLRPNATRNKADNPWGGRYGSYRYAKIDKGHWKEWD